MSQYGRAQNLRYSTFRKHRRISTASIPHPPLYLFGTNTATYLSARRHHSILCRDPEIADNDKHQTNTPSFSPHILCVAAAVFLLAYAPSSTASIRYVMRPFSPSRRCSSGFHGDRWPRPHRRDSRHGPPSMPRTTRLKGWPLFLPFDIVSRSLRFKERAHNASGLRAPPPRQSSIHAHKNGCVCKF